jgi:ionotropic glutamate receptor
MLFDRQVWLGLGVSIVCVITVLNVIMSSSATWNIIPHSKLHLVQTTIHRLKKKITKGETGKEYLYVFGNLLS